MLAELCGLSPFRFEELILDLFLLGDVPRDFCESAQAAGLVIQPCDDNARPEARAILSDPPAFCLELTLLPGHPQPHCWYYCGDILGGIEG